METGYYVLRVKTQLNKKAISVDSISNVIEPFKHIELMRVNYSILDREYTLSPECMKAEVYPIEKEDRDIIEQPNPALKDYSVVEEVETNESVFKILKTKNSDLCGLFQKQSGINEKIIVAQIKKIL